jgi:hypothetical protein
MRPSFAVMAATSADDKYTTNQNYQLNFGLRHQHAWMKRNLKKKAYTKLLSLLPSTQKPQVVHCAWAIKHASKTMPP